MYVYMFMFLMYDIVVLYTCCGYMNGMIPNESI